MKLKFIRAAAGWLTAAVLLSVSASSAPVTSAKSSVLLDATTGRVLYANNADARSLIASTTKIMTGLLISEECDLNTKVAVHRAAVGIEGSSVSLKENEVVSVELLLYGMMLQSGNDAAAALAIYNSGSIEAFADKMNRKAAELGLCNTHFVNPHGLDAKYHYSTALDLAKLTACAMENETFRKVVSTRSVKVDGRTFTNHNKLLWSYEGAIGVKTGYTSAAGRILVSAAERAGLRLIAVTISDRNDWSDHKALLDYGFSTYSAKETASRGRIVGKVFVIGGAEETVDAVVNEDILCCLSRGEHVTLRPNLPLFVYAPILAGEPAGTLSVMIDEKEVRTVQLYWRYSVLEEA